MGKVAGAQNFDGRNWPLRSVMPGTRWRNWPVTYGAVPNIGDGPLPHARSSAEATLPSGSAVGRTLCGRRT